MIISPLTINIQNEIPPNISEQIKEVIRVIKVSPDNVGVEIVSGMYRQEPTDEVPAGYIGCDLLLYYNLNLEHKGILKLFLRHATCEAILFFGEDQVKEFIWGMINNIINDANYHNKIVII